MGQRFDPFERANLHVLSSWGVLIGRQFDIATTHVFNGDWKPRRMLECCNLLANCMFLQIGFWQLHLQNFYFNCNCSL